jgi:hypothetical protein
MNNARYRSATLALGLSLAAGAAAAWNAVDHPVQKRAFNLPPSAELHYTIKGSNHGFPLSGTGVVTWQLDDGKYTLTTEARSALFGKVLEQRSEGAVDDYGLAPASYYDKRMRRDANTTLFKRDSKTIEFDDGKNSYPLKGGEQDRSSAPWQLLAIARQAPEKFTVGSEWAFFVAGRRDAVTWIFKVVGHETLETGMGELKALHLVKMPPKSEPGQQVDLWLAPGLEWYPARIRFVEENGDSFEQLLEKVNRK